MNALYFFAVSEAIVNDEKILNAFGFVKWRHRVSSVASEAGKGVGPFKGLAIRFSLNTVRVDQSIVPNTVHTCIVLKVIVETSRRFLLSCIAGILLVSLTTATLTNRIPTI